MMTNQEVEEELITTLAPFIKEFPESGSRPKFRKKLTGSEVEELLGNLYDLTRKISK